MHPATALHPIALYQRFTRWMSYLQSPVLLLIRLAWGWELLESGWGHLHNVQTMVDRFIKWGIPHPLANVYISGSTEMIGGILLMLGLCSRVISVPLIINFCVAYLTASRDNVVHFFSQDPSNIIDDAAFPFLITSLLVLAFGPGKFSVDYILHRLLVGHGETRGFEPVVQSAGIQGAAGGRCFDCKALVASDARFCQQCGAKVAERITPSATRHRQN